MADIFSRLQFQVDDRANSMEGIPKKPSHRQAVPKSSAPLMPASDLWSLLSNWLRSRFGMAGVVVLAGFGISHHDAASRQALTAELGKTAEAAPGA